MPDKKTFSIKSLSGLHDAGEKLRVSQQERDKYIKDPLSYLKTMGLELSADLAPTLKSNAQKITEVLTTKHDAIASIAVA